MKCLKCGRNKIAINTNPESFNGDWRFYCICSDAVMMQFVKDLQMDETMQDFRINPELRS